MTRYLVTLEIESKANPVDWNWDDLLMEAGESYKVIHTEGIEE